MKTIYSTLFSLLFFASFAKAQDGAPQKLSLQDCMDYALQHNYTIKNSQLDILIQEAQNGQTASIAYPNVVAKAEFDDFIRPQRSFINAKAFGGPDAITSVAFTVPYAASTGISASQLIFDGSAIVALQARKMALELARNNASVTAQSVRYNIFKAYFALAVGYKQREILTKSLLTGRSMLQELIVVNQSGFAEKIDVQRTNVQINNLQNDSASLENGIRLYEYALKFSMGMDIKTPITITDIELEGHARTAADLLLEGTNYDNLPSYTALKTVKILNEYNLRRYHLSALPSLVAFGAYGTNYGSDKFSDMFKFNRYEANATFGLQLNLPIFAGFQRVFHVKETKLNIEKVKNNIDNLKLAIDFTAEEARGSLKNLLIQLKSQTENMNLAGEVVDLAQKKYKAGVGSNLEVTTAQAELLKAQNSYFSTVLNIINAEGDLKNALGKFN